MTNIISPVIAEERCDERMLNKIEGSINLSEDCVYKKSIKINNSNTILDCNKSKFVGDDKLEIGLFIDSEGR